MVDKVSHSDQSCNTPPESPTGPTYYANKPSRRILIDDNGVHDFDLRKRQESGGPRKLQKFSRRTTNSISSINEIQRTPSNSSDTGSLRKRFSSLLNTKSDTHRTSSVHSRSSSIDMQEDPLPDTKKELEVRLNYHLSELDMLKKTIGMANDVIQQHQDRYQILLTRCTNDMNCAMQVQAELVVQARKNRDTWVDFVSFHRKQLERIKHKRIEIEKDSGLEPTLPQVYEQMWGDEEWGRLFTP